MMFNGTCGHCNARITATVQLPTTWDNVENALWHAHEAANKECHEGWMVDGLYDTTVSLGAEDRPSSVFNICRHAETNCGCYIRCPCGWLLPNGKSCPNPHHATEVKRLQSAVHP